MGTTTLFVTHDQEEALSMADRVGVMRTGTLEQIATPDELYAHPASAFVAEFVGIMNRIPGDVLDLLGTPTALVGADGSDAAGTAGGRDALVRPEGLRLVASPHGHGIVTARTFLGQLTRLSVRLSGDVVVQVDQRTSGAAGLSPGDSVGVSLAGLPVLLADRNGATPASQVITNS
ncbi:MAG TPA: TOBE domain-containing protein [Streptosporangiaceae bacterium]|nr:TOBE domain-containing protein [Streptosporangiaceae bacterium]